MASKLSLKFHPLAEKDLDEVLEWYTEVSTSLSKRFYIELQRNILIALEHPELYPIKYGCRKISLTRFPYLIFYHVIKNDLIILAIFHGYRNPKTIKSQLKGR